MEQPRICAYPCCSFYHSQAEFYCTTACACDHTDFKKLTLNEKEEAKRIGKIGKRPAVRRPL